MPLAQGRAVPRASDKLKFDQFFTPESGGQAVADAPSPEGASVEPPSAELPIEELASAPPPDEGEPPSASAPDDDDLDQFHGWLKGLTT